MTTPTTPLPQTAAEEAVVIAQAVGPRRAPQSVPTFVETTPVPGLVLGPRIRQDILAGRCYFDGDWAILHAASGWPAMICPHMGLGRVREAVALLGRAGIDWTRPIDELRRDHIAREAVHSTMLATRDATAKGSPVLLHTTSWRQLPPPWSADAFNEHGDVIEGYACPTYTDAENAAINLGEDLGLTSPDTHGDITIRRLQDPDWELHCARSGCHEALIDDDINNPQRDSDRQVLTESAEYRNWRQLDPRRWLCPACNHQFQAVTPDEL